MSVFKVQITFRIVIGIYVSLNSTCYHGRSPTSFSEVRLRKCTIDRLYGKLSTSFEPLSADYQFSKHILTHFHYHTFTDPNSIQSTHTLHLFALLNTSSSSLIPLVSIPLNKNNPIVQPRKPNTSHSFHCRFAILYPINHTPIPTMQQCKTKPSTPLLCTPPPPFLPLPHPPPPFPFPFPPHSNPIKSE